MANAFHIKQTAELSGASRKAIYLYEQMGLLNNVGRDSNDYRLYDDHHVVVIQLIKRAQELGFRLAEMAPLVQVKGTQMPFPTERVVSGIEQKRSEIAAEIAALEQRNSDLSGLALQLQSNNCLIDTPA